MQFESSLRNAILSAVSTALGAGGTLDVRTGSAPGVGTVSGTLLATLTGVTYGSPSAGAMTVSATADSAGDASGTPGHYNLKTSGGTVKIQGTAGVGSGELSFDTTISLGGAVSLTSGSITSGNA